MNGPPLLAVLCLLAGLPSSAVQIRAYDPARHDRFTGFPSAPVSNPGFLFDNSRFTGLAWGVSNIERQFALVSRRHFVCATHYRPALGSSVRFLASDGSLVTRTISAFATVTGPDSSPSDLTLGTLSAPVMPADGVSPFPYLNLASESAYLGTSLMVFGQHARAGSATISSFDDISVSDVDESRGIVFSYRHESGDDDDANLEEGDSGSPSFALVNGVPAIVGTHSAISAGANSQSNFDTFLPHYVAGLDDLMAPAGHRMRPVYSGPANLNVAVTPSPDPLRRGHPGEVLIGITNHGSHTAGNVELALSFPAGTAPDTVTAPDWIIDIGPPGTWLLRRTTLEDGETKSITATWATLPLDQALDGTLDHLSDASPAGSAAIDTPLAPSYAEWADENSVDFPTDDPDFDRLDNLLEYALGGDPNSGVLLLDGIHPLTLQVELTGSTATASFPRRTDADLRGISYIVEWSSDLAAGSWTTTPPAGSTTTDEHWIPFVSGFQRHLIRWPTTTGPRFARLRVELDESP